ncbi:hypothetical protein E2C01_085237 [Portunus trituberculatus]|uniref:Uncharacterized protein n=1 Tax=Portunus trituberculatus TaxID=210409 RepID=A0A5B7IXB7_PORTR|nr:hypothetical protein [Portunus trituberculatus]
MSVLVPGVRVEAAGNVTYINISLACCDCCCIRLPILSAFHVAGVNDATTSSDMVRIEYILCLVEKNMPVNKSLKVILPLISRTSSAIRRNVLKCDLCGAHVFMDEMEEKDDCPPKHRMLYNNNNRMK